MRVKGERRTRGGRGSARATRRASGATGTAKANATGGERVAPGSATAGRGQEAARGHKAARPGLYEEVSRRIVAELEAGRFAWAQPWGRQGTAGVGLPRNALTGRCYSGVNVLILWGAVIEHGYPSQGWLTFRQALAAGGAVRKGERGTTVVFADRFVPRDQRASASGADIAAAADTAAAPETTGRAVSFLKRFTVFNVAQCEGLRPGLAADSEPLPEREIVPVAERVIAASGVTFRVNGDRAFYAPGPDLVQVPPQPAFFDQINYYRTALHELTHATGHRTRLDRKLVSGFGTKDYAREELVAELGAAFLCATLGIVPTVRHADYLASWIEVLREDSRAIFRAASAAGRAAEWLLARDGARVPSPNGSPPPGGAANAGAAA